MRDPQVTIEVPPRRSVGPISIGAKDLADIKATFETLSKNISALPAVFTRDASNAISTITYGNGELIKTFQRTSSGVITAVVLSGVKIGKYELTKTLHRASNGSLAGFSYSQRELPG